MEKLTGQKAWKLFVNLIGIEQRKEQNNFLIYHQYLGMVKSVVAKLNYPSQIEFDDLVQVGTVVLLNCLDTYDPRKSKFVTYAQTAVYNRIINYINKWRISFTIPPQSWEQFNKKVGKMGRANRNNRYFISGKDFEQKSFSIDNLSYISKEMLGSFYDPYSQIELNLFLDSLNKRERLILLQKDILGATEKELSVYHQISKQRVSQIYLNSILKLRRKYNIVPSAN